MQMDQNKLNRVKPNKFIPEIQNILDEFNIEYAVNFVVEDVIFYDLYIPQKLNFGKNYLTNYIYLYI